MGVAVRVIPCLDVDAGRVVKGVNFTDLRDAGDPVEMARVYDAEGADELTFLDVTASSAGRATMLDVVRRTAEQVFIPLTVGGGIRSTDDVDTLLRAGADKVSINTAAIARPSCCTRPAAGSAPSASSCPSTRARCPPAARRPRRAGRSPPTAAAAAPGSTRSSGPPAASSSASGRSCSTRWTPTAPGRLRPGMIAAVRAAVDVPVIASGGAGELDALRAGGARRRRRRPRGQRVPLRALPDRRGQAALRAAEVEVR